MPECVDVEEKLVSDHDNDKVNAPTQDEVIGGIIPLALLSGYSLDERDNEVLSIGV
jgi:hypothetical protein